MVSKKTLLPLVLVTLLLAGCSASPAVSAPVIEASARQSASLPPEETPTPAIAPTPTPIPTPSPSPEPTAIPTPTPTPEAVPTPEPVSMSYEEVDALLWEKGALCGVAYLGEDPQALAVGSPALLAVGGYNWLYPFLGNSGSIQLVEWSGSQVYAIIPRSDAAISYYEFYMNKDYSFTDGLGQYITDAAPGQCAILRCGDSVTMPNCILLINASDGQARYIPRVTLGDGRLLTGEGRILDLTIYGFDLNG